VKIILSSSDLYTKSSKRPKYHEVFGLRAACFDKISSHDPFVRYKGGKLFGTMIAKKFKKMGAISHAQYLLFIAGQQGKEILKSMKLLRKGWVDVKVLEPKIICGDMYTVNLDRSLPYILGNIHLIECANKKKKISMSLLLSAIKTMLKFKILSLFHAIQYLEVKKSLSLINKNKSTFVIEEGVNSFITYVMFCNKMMGGKVILTQKQVATESSLIMYCDEIFCSNVVANNINLKDGIKSSHIEFKSEIDKAQISYGKTGIGFAIDMGTLFLGKKDKEVYDSAMNEICFECSLQLIYSIHPQEKVKKKAYYQNLFSAPLASYRGENTLEEFFSEIDILIVWWSTLVSQAITCGKFVILLDFFDDRQGAELEQLVPNVVKRAKNKDDLVKYIQGFRSIPENKRQEYFLEANTLVFQPK